MKIYQTTSMELVFACLACDLGKASVNCMDDIVANSTFFNSFKLLISILLPHFQSVDNCAILMIVIVTVIIKVLSEMRRPNKQRKLGKGNLSCNHGRH